MTGSVLHLEGLIARLAVVDESFYFMYALMQAAAERHVHFLETTADAQDRDAGGHGRADQRQGGAVAIGIVLGAGRGSGPLISMGLHIGRGAGKEKTVQTGQEGRLVHQFSQGRNHQRHTTGSNRYRTKILVTRYMIGLEPDLSGASGYADQRQARHETPVLFVCYGFRPSLALFILLHNRAVKN
ncbi:hypothetical protein D3C72_1397050 [compost metagenome]